ncbi:MAG: T9SS type A sorting domain-containing protein [Ignavibacteriales bacterium]|nr:T9SS type A sorting domain-containing protein [Ignavibacteriales bacterium]
MTHADADMQTINFTNNSGLNYPLPVELTSFNAAIRNGLVDLKWETATEVNNYGFEVERKSTNADWSKIGFVEGHNSTNSPKYYSYSDKPEGTGKIAYRLKQIDNDGQFEYSPEVEVLVDNLPNGFVLEQNYPNPFNPETSIRFALKEDTKATLKVYNSLGAEIATLFDGTAEAGRYYDVKFGGSELASGFYIYKLVAGEYVSVKKMLLMK